MLATPFSEPALCHFAEGSNEDYRALIVLCFCATLCRAQAAKTHQALLSEVREKYDAPFDRNLQSFDCAVDFSWKQHFTETTRVGDEGTDEELEKISSSSNLSVPGNRFARELH